MVRNARLKDLAGAAAEIALAVAAAAVLVALLEGIAPATSLGVVFVLAVLFVAIRRGELAAVVTAFASVLVLNFFFIAPRHRLTISDDRNVVALAVLLIAALVVGRLAAAARAKAQEAAQRADQTAAREREAMVLAEAASALLAEPTRGGSALVGPRLEGALEAAGARLELKHAPCPRAGEIALPLRTTQGSGWLYVDRDGPWTRAEAERIVRALGELADVAHLRARVADRAAEAEATRRADVAKTAIMHAISHDLRTPLTAITTAAGALGETTLSEDDRRELASVVGAEAYRLERMVSDLLDLSRIEAGAVNPQTDWCDVGETVTRAADQVRAHRGEHPIRIDLAPALPLVRADASQLERVFTNLIDNAVKFSPSDNPIEVRGAAANGRVTIRVIDHGRGIPPAQQAQVFEPFVRGRDAQPGSGLGLAICRGFVEANGGRITLQSRGRDGSAFAVSFPVAQQPSVVG
jgi:two-component system, OmpR family, sensor histidine kinase KdpD